MLQIILPMTLVLGSVGMNINSIAVRLIFIPVAFENIAVNMEKLASSARFVVFPVAFIPGPIYPLLDAEAIPVSSNPLSFVNCPALEPIRIKILD
jgi:hypothetical protein